MACRDCVILLDHSHLWPQRKRRRTSAALQRIALPTELSFRPHHCCVSLSLQRSEPLRLHPARQCNGILTKAWLRLEPCADIYVDWRRIVYEDQQLVYNGQAICLRDRRAICLDDGGAQIAYPTSTTVDARWNRVASNGNLDPLSKGISILSRTNASKVFASPSAFAVVRVRTFRLRASASTSLCVRSKTATRRVMPKGAEDDEYQAPGVPLHSLDHGDPERQQRQLMCGWRRGGRPRDEQVRRQAHARPDLPLRPAAADVDDPRGRPLLGNPLCALLACASLVVLSADAGGLHERQRTERCPRSCLARPPYGALRGRSGQSSSVAMCSHVEVQTATSTTAAASVRFQ